MNNLIGRWIKRAHIGQDRESRSNGIGQIVQGRVAVDSIVQTA